MPVTARVFPLNILKSGGHSLIHGKCQTYNFFPHATLPLRDKRRRLLSKEEIVREWDEGTRNAPASFKQLESPLNYLY